MAHAFPPGTPVTTANPPQLADCLILSRDPDDDDLYYDVGYYGTDARWYSACGGGELIPNPVQWWQLPDPPLAPNTLPNGAFP